MVTYKRNSVCTFLQTQPPRVGMIETLDVFVAVSHDPDPAPAGWDD